MNRDLKSEARLIPIRGNIETVRRESVALRERALRAVDRDRP